MIVHSAKEARLRVAEASAFREREASLISRITPLLKAQVKLFGVLSDYSTGGAAISSSVNDEDMQALEDRVRAKLVTLDAEYAIRLAAANGKHTQALTGLKHWTQPLGFVPSRIDGMLNQFRHLYRPNEDGDV